MTGHRVLAAVGLDEHGGGLAAVSRLIWATMGAHWDHEAHLLTVVDDAKPARWPDKVLFGARLAAWEISGRARWVLFAHLGLARAQARVPRRLQRPYAIFLHGIEAWCPLSASDRAILARASLRVANSDYTARRVMAAHPDIGPVLTCPLALPPDDGRATSIGQLRTGQEDRLDVLMVSRLDAGECYKGHAEVIAAWPLVVAACPRATLTIVGDGTDASRLRRLAGATGVAERITFTGFVDRDRLLQLYSSASVFLLPSRGEGFGLVYLEAMVHGLPCIGSVHDAAGEVILDGLTGHLVHQDSRAEIAARVIELLTDARQRERLGNAGQARARDIFSFRRFDARFSQLIERHLEPSPAVSTGQSAPSRSV